MSSNNTPQPDPRIADAIDDLAENDFELQNVAPENHSAGTQIMGVLCLLERDTCPSPSSSLISDTLSRISSQAETSTTTQATPLFTKTLSAEDKVILDLLVDHQMNTAAIPEAQRPRAEKILKTFQLLDALPAQSPLSTEQAIINKTLARVNDQRQKDRLTQQINDMAIGTGAAATSVGLRWSELFAMAAMFLIGISLFWPMFDQANATARQAVCQSNLSSAGMGMMAYASDNRGSMPSVKAKLGDAWWNTNSFDQQGNARSNTAHLHRLYQSNYVRLKDLNCPENQFAPATMTAAMRDWPNARSTSFAYQNQYTQNKPLLNGRVRVVILADKNPYFTSGEYRMNMSRNANSSNHRKLGGQNVLMSSGEVLWLLTPTINGDNIYQAGDDWKDNYTGTEGPANEADSFVVGP